MVSFKRSVIFLLFVCLFSMSLSAQTRSGKFGIGLGAGGTYLLGDATNPNLGYSGSLSAFYSIIPGLGVRANAGIEQLGWKSTNKNITTDCLYDNLVLSADFLPNHAINPFLYGGGGIVFFDPKDKDGNRAANQSSFDMQYIVGGGVDYFLSEFWSVTAKGEYVMTNSKYYGYFSNSNGSFIRASLEVRYYFFDQTFITKMLEAIKDRYKKK
jgi:hypothetical protein